MKFDWKHTSSQYNLTASVLECCAYV